MRIAFFFLLSVFLYNEVWAKEPEERKFKIGFFIPDTVFGTHLAYKHTINQFVETVNYEGQQKNRYQPVYFTGPRDTSQIDKTPLAEFCRKENLDYVVISSVKLLSLSYENSYVWVDDYKVKNTKTTIHVYNSSGDYLFTTMHNTENHVYGFYPSHYVTVTDATKVAIRKMYKKLNK